MIDLDIGECPTCYLKFKEIEALREVANAARDLVVKAQ